jgi:predicted component of type VI protein secretion system
VNGPLTAEQRHTLRRLARASRFMVVRAESVRDMAVQTADLNLTDLEDQLETVTESVREMNNLISILRMS